MVKGGVPAEHAPAREGLQAEFDLLAEAYAEVHARNVAITGERPDYFARYKIADLARSQSPVAGRPASILDFGCGIGNSIPPFREFFPDSELYCADVSVRSIEIAQGRHPGAERFLAIRDTVPLPDACVDLVFSACVFHHIPHVQHAKWLSELLRICRPGGVLSIYEHNPLNPLTLRAVNTCPLDVNARLIRARTLRERVRQSGWTDVRVEFNLFFPSFLASLRPLEPQLKWLPFGAQYCVRAVRPGGKCPPG
jgi:SAM-dependent methyltransferase